MKYRVVCQAFRSVEFDSAPEAQDHLMATRLNTKCPYVHRVEFTELPYGSTARRLKKEDS